MNVRLGVRKSPPDGVLVDPEVVVVGHHELLGLEGRLGVGAVQEVSDERAIVELRHLLPLIEQEGVFGPGPGLEVGGEGGHRRVIDRPQLFEPVQVRPVAVEVVFLASSSFCEMAEHVLDDRPVGPAEDQGVVLELGLDLGLGLAHLFRRVEAAPQPQGPERRDDVHGVPRPADLGEEQVDGLVDLGQMLDDLEEQDVVPPRLRRGRSRRALLSLHRPAADEVDGLDGLGLAVFADLEVVQPERVHELGPVVDADRHADVDDRDLVLDLGEAPRRPEQGQKNPARRPAHGISSTIIV